MNTKILFRVDGHSQMGLGHIVRSLALVRMLKSNFNCHFAIQNPPKGLLPQIKGYCKGLIELPTTNLLIEEAKYLCEHHLTGREIVVLDGYHFGTEYQQIIKNSGCKVVCIDDIHDKHFVADAIINHTGGITEDHYSKEDYTQCHFGLNYALLRQPFLEAAKNRFSPNAHPIAFVCLGGADPKNDTLKVLKRLETTETVKQCYVVIGAAYLHRKELEVFISKSKLGITLLENICATRMIDIMRICSVAITSPSTISIEYLSVGGDLFLYQTADNQNDLFNYLTLNQLAFNFNELPPKDKKNLASARVRQQEILDGKSGQRLLKVFLNLEKVLHCKIRQADINDMMTLFEWKNEEETRQQSLSTQTISFAEHKRWFFQKLSSEDCRIYILEYKGQPVGQIRFDIQNNTVLSFSVDPNARGKGFGTYLLETGIKQLKKDTHFTKPIIGYVKEGNIASNKSFTKLGFQRTQAQAYENVYVYAL
ncbi:UDP-2,4-diacetamido-2,4,6-trideoxy-beta-L-altropyranose hydrolase [Saprospiraceae bacterium]|jgi:UDP-2,4-diacetamido-2,4,6-trideoxy-beta-L-altropyranose hydrolase|nr:UDP-2,4-diacetamido-2,4,6-trideoxy-beta-L-altropyranose hydrolase [Saprospiraceae bacterium]MDF1867017.1 UDP-2,4-diacetamido-2,4,6-trideoxy-beta-L-altropyranose hydrolase [Saprospiraceae bacterium]